MINNKLAIARNEELIKSLTVLKLRVILEDIKEEEFQEEFNRIYKDECFTDIVESLSYIAVKQVLDQIKLSLKDDYKNAKVIINHKRSNDKNIFEVILITKDYIHVMKIISMEYDFIESDSYEEMMMIGYDALDRYLCNTNSKTMDLTVIQPNLLIASTCTVNIDDFLKACEE